MVSYHFLTAVKYDNITNMENPTISDLIIATLFSGRSTRLFRAILHNRQLKRYRKESVRVALTRLGKKGYLCNSKSGWYLSSEGKKFAEKKRLLDYLQSPFDKTDLNSVIVAFDIPEQKRVYRDWLRNQLKIFGYKMLQQSLWFGPGPLPPVFIQRLKDLKIRENIKTFRVKKLT